VRDDGSDSDGTSSNSGEQQAVTSTLHAYPGPACRSVPGREHHDRADHDQDGNGELDRSDRRHQNLRVNGSGFLMRMSSRSGTSTYGRLNARNLAGFWVWNSGSPKNSTPNTMMPVTPAIMVA